MKFCKILFMMLALCCSVTAYSNDQLSGLCVVRCQYCEVLVVPNVSNDLQVTVYGKSKVYDELNKQSGKNVNGHPLK